MKVDHIESVGSYHQYNQTVQLDSGLSGRGWLLDKMHQGLGAINVYLATNK